MRACSEDLTDDSPAIAQLRAAQQLKAPKSAETIRKIAQKHRDKVLEKFEQTSHAELGEMMIRLTANAKQVEDLLCTISGAGSEQQQLDGQKLIDHWTRRELTPQKKKAWRRYLLRKSPHMRD
jgi:truncated hemoglobin YjbI